MAYDENGNYYFNPEIDEYDRDMVQDEHKREMARNYVRTQHEQAKNQHEMNQMFHDALKDADLTHEEYNNLANLDPSFVKQAYADHVRSMVNTVKSRARDPKTGQFIKQSQAPQTKAPGMRDDGVDQARIDALREKGRTQGLSSDSDIEDMLDHVIGRLI